uniref:Uncharacterized protein n=1 Tax=Arundo donax TaxID=35708 RepID=A0A0A9DEC3_ARUDO
MIFHYNQSSKTMRFISSDIIIQEDPLDIAPVLIYINYFSNNVTVYITCKFYDKFNLRTHMLHDSKSSIFFCDCKGITHCSWLVKSLNYFQPISTFEF